jgi:hypothetical protein
MSIFTAIFHGFALSFHANPKTVHILYHQIKQVIFGSIIIQYSTTQDSTWLLKSIHISISYSWTVLSTDIRQSKSGIGKLRPAGQIQPAASFFMARELRMDFTFSNSLKFQSTRYNGTVCGAHIASHSHAAWWPLLWCHAVIIRQRFQWTFAINCDDRKY